MVRITARIFMMVLLFVTLLYSPREVFAQNYSNLTILIGIGDSLTHVADYLLINLNSIMGLNAPYYNLSQIITKDLYIDRDGDGWAPGPNYSASGITQLLFLFKDPDDTNPNVQPVLPAGVWNIISNVLCRVTPASRPASFSSRTIY
jgi:hypothetical protein